MKRKLAFLLAAALVCALSILAAAESAGETLRAAYRAVGELPENSPYAVEPETAAPYAPGELTDEAAEDALRYLNFIRELAGLEPVSRNRIYDYRSQHGAVLLAAWDYVDHNAPQPADMAQEFYESAHMATASSNIAKFNWMRPTILREGLAYFVRDDGEGNLPVLGHRRWLLNPAMADTGFGLANSESGMSYVVMYAHDFGNADAKWDTVKWPSEGAFPVELMHGNLAWSVSLNPELYDAAHSQIRVHLTEATNGLSFDFNCTDGTGDGFCTVSMENYGSGPCIIFRPDFSGTDFTDYQQNQKWTVRIDGIRAVTGETVSLEYSVDMVSLYVQEVANVEMSLLEAELKISEVLKLTASVIPAYADDLSVTWSSSDESVAVVDDNGNVTAVGCGECEIRAQSVNGRYDYCEVTVAE